MNGKISDNYLDYLTRLNEPSNEQYEIAARSYETNYGQFLPKDRNVKILDVGCGMGHFLYYLKEKGYTNFFGIDIEENQIEFCRRNFTENVETANVLDYLKNCESIYDTIIMNDVIEHIQKKDTMILLDYVITSLKSKGVIIIKTPNMNNLFGLSFRYQDFTHEMGFTEVTLSQIMNAAGFINIALVPEVYAKFGFKRRIANIIRSIFYKVISIAHIINNGKAPEILTPNLILVAQKE